MHIDIDKYAHLNSPFHNWDPRFKIVSFAFFIIVVSFLKNILLLLFVLFISLFFVFVSKIPVSHLIRRLKYPFYFFLMAFVFLPLTSKGEIFDIVYGVPIYYSGIKLALTILFRGLSIIILIILLFGTAPFDKTIRSLHSLKVPGTLIDIILFTYRYIFQYLENIRKLKIAMKLKGLDNGFSLKKIPIISNLIITLLIRSFEQTENILYSMILRGYKGSHFMIDFPPYSKFDIIKSVTFFILTITILTIELSIR